MTLAFGYKMRRFLTLLLLSISAACSVAQRTEQAEQAVMQFRGKYDESLFTEIYASADTALKRASTQKEFIVFMEAVRRKMGRVKSAALTGSNVHVGTSGARVSLMYQTEFEQGEGVEQFIWQVRGDEARLLGYNINSPTLVVK